MNYRDCLTSSSSVVTPGDGSKTFLSCGVPNLETSYIVAEKVLVIIKESAIGLSHSRGSKPGLNFLLLLHLLDHLKDKKDKKILELGFES